jgi:chemotaxis signal transduction protein
MSPARSKQSISLDELRREFDLGFSRPTEFERHAQEDLLLFSVAGGRYAVRLGEVRAILQTPRLAWVPSGFSALRGVVAWRGELIPVFDFAELLGHPAERELGRWSLLAGDSERAAFAFHHFERFERVPVSALSKQDAQTSASGGTSENVVRLAREIVPIVSVNQVLANLAQEAGAANQEKEPA